MIAAPEAISTKPLTLSSSIVANVPAPEVFTYDANGNLLANKTKEFTWSLRNELLSVRPFGTPAPTQPSIVSLAPGALASPLVAKPLTAISLTPTIDPIIYFTYDHNGERVTKKGPTSKVTYVSGSYEVEDISGIRTTRVYVYDGTNLVSTVEQVSNSPVVTTYAHSDHLGSSSLVTDSGGTIVQQLDYLPYGEERVAVKAANTSDLAKKYTGKELDEETGLYYYGARYYDSRIARFVSADPVSRDISMQKLFAQPQAWNTYAYTINNPIRYTDPDGRMFEKLKSNIELGAIFSYEYADAFLGDALPDQKYNDATKNAAAQIGNETAKAQAKAEIVAGAFGTAAGGGTMGASVITLSTCGVTAGGGCLAAGAQAAAGATVAGGSAAMTAHGGIMLNAANGKNYNLESDFPYNSDGKLTPKAIKSSVEIAGPGTQKSVIQGKRLVEQYKGKINDWYKMTTKQFFTPKGDGVQVHYYYNKSTRQIVEPKSKLQNNYFSK